MFLIFSSFVFDVLVSSALSENLKRFNQIIEIRGAAENFREAIQRFLAYTRIRVDMVVTIHNDLLTQ